MTGSSQNGFNEVLLSFNEVLALVSFPERPSVPACIRGSAAPSVALASLGQSAAQTAAVMRAGRPPARSASAASARSTFSRKMRTSASCTCAITARAAAEAARGGAAARRQGVKARGDWKEFLCCLLKSLLSLQCCPDQGSPKFFCKRLCDDGLKCKGDQELSCVAGCLEKFSEVQGILENYQETCGCEACNTGVCMRFAQ